MQIIILAFSWILVDLMSQLFKAVIYLKNALYIGREEITSWHKNESKLDGIKLLQIIF